LPTVRAPAARRAATRPIAAPAVTCAKPIKLAVAGSAY
jgi:hypothetical protein